MNGATAQRIGISSTIDELARGALLVSANNRLSREIKNSYDRPQVEKGHKVWMRGRI